MCLRTLRRADHVLGFATHFLLNIYLETCIFTYAGCIAAGVGIAFSRVSLYVCLFVVGATSSGGFLAEHPKCICYLINRSNRRNTFISFRATGRGAVV